MKFSYAGLASIALSAAAGVSAQTFATTGVQDGGSHLRMDIHTMNKQYPDTYNLMLLAMAQWQAMDQSEMLSFYGVAGLHGIPNATYNGYGPNPNNGGAVGYGMHNSPLFPMWHRMYTATFEQILYSHVQSVANSFPAGAQRTRYQAAANGFRLPYWDWAAIPSNGLPTFPYMFTNQYVSVNTPSGQQTIMNPLFRSNFNPFDGSAFLASPWNIRPCTLRWPTSETAAHVSSQNNLIQSSFTSNVQNSLKSAVYNTFTQCNGWNEFANEDATLEGSCGSSIESIHDTIHSLAGGANGGHMAWLWYAAFDPVFFFHHANVDRITAMWQAIYPNSWVSSTQITGNSYTLAPGSTVDENTALTPFAKDTSGTSLTAKDARSISNWGYYYPETAPGTSASSVKAAVNTLYGGNSNANQKRGLISDLLNIPSNLTSAPNGDEYQYSVSIQTQRFGLNGPYSIYVFMGEMPENSEEWAFASNMIGVWGVFAQSGMTHHHNATSVATLPITDSLVNQLCNSSQGGSLESLSPAHVSGYLQQQLNWGVITNFGQVVNNADVPGLQVAVVSTQVAVPTEQSEFPSFSNTNILANVTQNKAGGVVQQVASDITSFLNSTGLRRRHVNAFRAKHFGRSSH